MFFRSVTQLILNPLVRAVEVKNSDQVDQLVLFRCTIWIGSLWSSVSSQ